MGTQVQLVDIDGYDGAETANGFPTRNNSFFLHDVLTPYQRLKNALVTDRLTGPKRIGGNQEFLPQRGIALSDLRCIVQDVTALKILLLPNAPPDVAFTTLISNWATYTDGDTTIPGKPYERANVTVVNNIAHLEVSNEELHVFREWFDSLLPAIKEMICMYSYFLMHWPTASMAVKGYAMSRPAYNNLPNGTAGERQVRNRVFRSAARYTGNIGFAPNASSSYKTDTNRAFAGILNIHGTTTRGESLLEANTVACRNYLLPLSEDVATGVPTFIIGVGAAPDYAPVVGTFAEKSGAIMFPGLQLLHYLAIIIWESRAAGDDLGVLGSTLFPDNQAGRPTLAVVSRTWHTAANNADPAIHNVAYRTALMACSTPVIGMIGRNYLFG